MIEEYSKKGAKIMNIVRDGCEHAFLVFLDRLKAHPSGWIACTFAFSKALNFEQMVEHKQSIRAQSDEFLYRLQEELGDLSKAHLFQFTDNDLIFLCCAQNEQEQIKIEQGLERIAASLPKALCDYGFLVREMPVFQKIADQKLLSARRMQIFQALTNAPYMESIPLRRKRRDEPVLLVIEDDRFTASYIGNFLKEFDVVTARTGEDGVLRYLEYAPDAVFLDVHLPGIDGNQALQAIKAADSEAFVVMLSVDTARSTIMNASEHGAISYLKKPFSRDRVLNTLRLSPFIRNSKGILPIERHQRF
jgi:two-component system, chemotaxis family, chemotaxis protein CheY